MIRNIRHRGLRQFWEEGSIKGIQPAYAEKIRRILFALNRARQPKDMSLPGYRLHPLTGELRGFWSVTVSANWRIMFRFEDNQVCEVELIDYH